MAGGGRLLSHVHAPPAAFPAVPPGAVRSHAGLVVERRNLVPEELCLVAELLVVELEALHLLEELHRDVRVVLVRPPHLLHVLHGFHGLALQHADLTVAELKN